MSESQETRPIALVVMGVSGSGKSTVAEFIAKSLNCEMIEGDRLHPQANVEKMRQGVPLTDEDRAPWLERIGDLLQEWAAQGRCCIVTCSALKRAYRAKILAARPDARFVYLKGSIDVIEARVMARHHEYMPASLLKSQFETLEEPAPDEPVITVDVSAPPEEEARAVLAAIGLSQPLGSAPR